MNKCPICGYEPVIPPVFKKSNADKIRSMSDNELADWLDELVTHCNDGPCFNCFMQTACLTSMLDWLKQEASNE